MTQYSWPWPGQEPGDGADAGPYTAAQWWQRIVAFLQVGGMVYPSAGSPIKSETARNNLGVAPNIGNEMEVTNPANQDVQIDTGAAIVEGEAYYNTEAVTLTLPLPAASTRIDYIVIRKNYTAAEYNPAGDAGDEEVPAYTARITRIVGTEGDPAPSLVHSTDRSTYWDIPLATVSITTGGAVTVTDAREFAPQWDTENLVDAAVTTAKIEDGAVTEAKHASAVSYGTYHVLYRNANESIQADSGGNARGAYAVDLQQDRSAAAEVASGANAFIAAGTDNTASGADSHAEGNGVTASGDQSHAEGLNAVASKKAEHAFSSLPALYGQGRRFVLHAQETHDDATWRTLYINDDGAAADTKMTLDEDNAWVVNVQIIGQKSPVGKTIGFELGGVVENPSGGNINIVQQSLIGTWDTEDVSFDAQLAVHIADDELLVQVSDSDGAGDTMRWVAVVRVAEVEHLSP